MSKGSKIQRWLIFGVAAPIVPLVLAITYRMVDGAYFRDLLEEFSPDFLLVVLSVAVNVVNSATTGKWKKLSLLFSSITTILCGGYYSWLFGLGRSPAHLQTIVCVSLGMFVLNACLGVWTETRENPSNTISSDA